MAGGARAALEGLAACVSAHKFGVKWTERGLVVTNPLVMVDCPAEGRRLLADTVTCRAYDKDAGRLWFFTSWGLPIAEADRVTDAVVVIKGYLSGSQGSAV